MATPTITNNKDKDSFEILLKELAEIKKYLKKFLLIIPEESLGRYKNHSKIKKAYQEAIRLFPSK